MEDITTTVNEQLTGPALQQISRQLGLDPAQAQQAVTAALPVVLAGMAKHSSSASGAAAIHQEADNHAIPADMTSLSNIFTGGIGGILGKILGNNQQTVQDGVSQASGIDVSQAGALISMIAPYVLAAVARAKEQRGLQPADIPGTLQQAQQTAHAQAQRTSPELGGILGSVLNQVMER